MKTQAWYQRFGGRGLALAAAVCLTLFASPTVLAATYYLDAESGSDSASGLCPEDAWRSLDKVNATTFEPGDRLLLRARCAWEGRLWPKGSGTKGAPIAISMYGEGARPVVNGCGLAQEAVHLYNQEYWEISNLEVTNFDPAGRAPRAGVRVLGEDAGPLHHIHLRGLDVHDVNGHFSDGRDSGKCNSGIVLDVIGSKVPTRFDDVLIAECYVHQCDRGGIKTWSDWNRHGCAEWAPYMNLVIRNNVLDDIGGDGIVACQADAPLIEYNVASRCNARSDTYNVAIWVWDCDDAVIQYNEAYLTRTTKDGQGFDVDGFTHDTVVQYNYSHDNEGGFILICNLWDTGECYFNDGAVVRYNISQNDRARIFQIGGSVTNAEIYNNTIYVGRGSGDPAIIWDRQPVRNPGTIRYVNNIIYNLGSGSYRFRPAENSLFDYNVFYGAHPDGEPDDPHKITDAPMLVDAGSGRCGRESVDGYKLRADSPCIDSGVALPACGGRDYWGNPAPCGDAPDRGAHEYQPGD